GRADPLLARPADRGSLPSPAALWAARVPLDAEAAAGAARPGNGALAPPPEGDRRAAGSGADAARSRAGHPIGPETAQLNSRPMTDVTSEYSRVNLSSDPIYRYLRITKGGPGGVPGECSEQDLLDSPWLQRLRRIHQLQSAWWVFATAEHSRLQHSLGAFGRGERVDPRWVAYLISKDELEGFAAPGWLTVLRPLLTGPFSADNMDYVPRDSYICGVAAGPVDIQRILHYSFISEHGLT